VGQRQLLTIVVYMSQKIMLKVRHVRVMTLCSKLDDITNRPPPLTPSPALSLFFEQSWAVGATFKGALCSCKVPVVHGIHRRRLDAFSRFDSEHSRLLYQRILILWALLVPALLLTFNVSKRLFVPASLHAFMAAAFRRSTRKHKLLTELINGTKCH
jgi:hypothetical protein